MRIGVMVGPERGRYATKVERLLRDARWAEEAGLAIGLDPADPRRVRRPHRRRRSSGAETTRIEIGTAVVPVQPRHPIALAQQALSVQAVCEGRLSLGLGVSHHWVIDEMLGLPYERPVPTMRAHLDVLDPALAGPGPGRRRERPVPGAQPARHHRRHARRRCCIAALGPADAAPRRRAHRRHDPLDGRRAGHRRPRRAPPHAGRRGRRAPGAPHRRRHPGVPVRRRRGRRRRRARPTASWPRPRSRRTTRAARPRRRPQRRRHPRRRAARRRSRSGCGPSPTPAPPTSPSGSCRSARAATSSSPRRGAPATTSPRWRRPVTRQCTSSHPAIITFSALEEDRCPTRPRHPGLRRRQPPLRDRGRAHQVPARPLQGRHRLRRGAGPHEDRRPRPDQRLHPQPDLRRRGPARAPRRTTSATATPRARAGGRSSASRCGRSPRSASRRPASS